MFGRKSAAIAFLFVGLAVVSSAPVASGINPPNATVTLTNFKFTPRTVRIKAGGTVTWNSKEGSHTVQADDGSFDSGTLTAGQSFSHRFEKPGTYRYFCSFHGSAGGHNMAGTVVVTR